MRKVLLFEAESLQAVSDVINRLAYEDPTLEFLVDDGEPIEAAALAAMLVLLYENVEIVEDLED